MHSENDWGEAIMPDGSHVPLQPPPFEIPEDQREIIVDRPGLVLWTRKVERDNE